jgi:hypothetical protein
MVINIDEKNETNANSIKAWLGLRNLNLSNLSPNSLGRTAISNLSRTLEIDAFNLHYFFFSKV